MILSLLVTAFLSSPSNAATVCQWTAQGTDANFANEEMYKRKPQIEKASCAKDGKPNCVGFAYCKDSEGKVPPQVIPMACPSYQGEGGKWRCTSAQKCIEDEVVVMAPMTKAPVVPAAPAQPAAGTGGAVREGTPK